MTNNPLETLLEIINHTFNKHPALMSHVRQPMTSEVDSDVLEWASRLYEAPSPKSVKQKVLLRNNLDNAVWIETGTFLGDTSEFLSNHARHVHTTEPESGLFRKARLRFEQNNKVTVHNEASETFLPRILPQLSGNVCIWLDGHYSGEGTFAGPNDTPLQDELRSISLNIDLFERVAILIDDIRLCGRKHVYGTYPSLGQLVSFAESLSLAWHIEHDIFVAKSQPKSLSI